jgi:hypothetical protein
MVVTSAARTGSLQTLAEVAEAEAELDFNASAMAAALSLLPAALLAMTRSMRPRKSESLDLAAFLYLLGVLPVLPPVPLVPASSPTDSRRLWT